MRLAASKYIPLIKRHIPEDKQVKFLAVMMAESGGDPRATNLDATDWHEWVIPRTSNLYDFSGVSSEFFPSTPWRGSYGLMQVGGYTAVKNRKTKADWYAIPGQRFTRVEQLFDPEVNIIIAAQLLKARPDWADWSTARSIKGKPAKYLAFMKAAEADMLESGTQTIPAQTIVADKEITQKHVEKFEKAVQQQPVNRYETAPKQPEPAPDYSRYNELATAGIKQTSKQLLKRYKWLDKAKRNTTNTTIGLGIHQLVDKGIMDLTQAFSFLEQFHSSLDTAAELLLIPVAIGLLSYAQEWYNDKFVQQPKAEGRQPNILLEWLNGLWSSALYTRKLNEDNGKGAL